MPGLVLLVCLALAAGSCYAPLESLSRGEQDYVRALEDVLSETRFRRWLDDSSDAPLLGNATLRALYSRSSENEGAVRSVLQSTEIDDDVKHLAILTMQCLPLEQYIELLRFLAAQTKAGRCSATLLAEAIFPGEDWGTTVADNYRHPQIAALLNDVLAGPQGSTVRDRVESVLSGDAARYIDHLRAIGSRAPFWDCEVHKNE